MEDTPQEQTPHTKEPLLVAIKGISEKMSELDRYIDDVERDIDETIKMLEEAQRDLLYDESRREDLQEIKQFAREEGYPEPDNGPNIEKSREEIAFLRNTISTLTSMKTDLIRQKEKMGTLLSRYQKLYEVLFTRERH